MFSDCIRSSTWLSRHMSQVPLCPSLVQKLFQPHIDDMNPILYTYTNTVCSKSKSLVEGTAGENTLEKPRVVAAALPPPPHLHTWAPVWPAPRAGCRSGHRSSGSYNCKLWSDEACRFWNVPFETEDRQGKGMRRFTQNRIFLQKAGYYRAATVLSWILQFKQPSFSRERICPSNTTHPLLTILAWNFHPLHVSCNLQRRQ